MLWLGDTEMKAFMWQAREEARAEGLLPGQRTERSHYQAGLCRQEAAFNSQEAEFGWYQPLAQRPGQRFICR